MPGAAQPVDGEGGDLDGNAGLEADVARAVDRVAGGLERVAHDDVVDPAAAATPGALEGGPRRVRSELEGGDVLERADVLGHGRARAAQDQGLFTHRGCVSSWRGDRLDLAPTIPRPFEALLGSGRHPENDSPLRLLRCHFPVVDVSLTWTKARLNLEPMKLRSAVPAAWMLALLLPGCNRGIPEPLPRGRHQQGSPDGGRDRVHERSLDHDRGCGARGLLDRCRRIEPDPPDLLQHGERRVRLRDGLAGSRRQARGHDPGEDGGEWDLTRLQRPQPSGGSRHRSGRDHRRTASTGPRSGTSSPTAGWAWAVSRISTGPIRTARTSRTSRRRPRFARESRGSISPPPS